MMNYKELDFSLRWNDDGNKANGLRALTPGPSPTRGEGSRRGVCDGI